MALPPSFALFPIFFFFSTFLGTGPFFLFPVGCSSPDCSQPPGASLDGFFVFFAIPPNDGSMRSSFPQFAISLPKKGVVPPFPLFSLQTFQTLSSFHCNCFSFPSLWVPGRLPPFLISTFTRLLSFLETPPLIDPVHL